MNRQTTCSHCSGDMSKQKAHETCSNGSLCESIEDYDQRKHKALREAAEELVRIAYAHGRGGIVEFRPHEFDDLKDAL